MVIAIDPGEEFDYVLLADRVLPEDDPNRTVWKLRPLTRKEITLLEDRTEMQRGGGFRLNLGTIKEDTVRAGLIGCRNFRDARGTEIHFEQADKTLNVLGRNCRPPADRFLDRIPAAALMELADAIQEGAKVTVEEGKG